MEVINIVKSNLISDEELDGVSGGVLQATEHTVSVKSSNCLSFIRSASNVAVMFGASWCGPA